MHKKTTALLYSLIAFSTLHAAPTKTDDCGTTASPYRASARHIEGKGIGYKRGYTSVDLFMAPPSTLQHRFVPFIDARLHIFDNGKIATNAGIGLRYISSSFVYGINSYYDYRETSHQKYNQYSLGLEALGKVWDFRLNGYLPVGNKKSDFYNTRFGYFQGHNMYLNTTREFAMKGLNAEAGIHIKDLSFMKVYGAFGPYYFEKQGQNAIGGKVRASLTFLDHIKIEASTSYDPIFHWIGQGELSFMIPFGPKKKLKQQPNCRRPYLNERAVQQVDRQEIIVVDHKHYSPIAIDPTTNAPWNFVFVDNLSHSLGTYESPYPTLLEAQDNSVPRDIIYVFPGDGTDTGMDEGITLQLNQKLFGSGIDIPLATTMGEIVIPKQSTSFPLITNQVGEIAIVTLSDNNEVAGLNLTTDNTLNYGIVGGDPFGLTTLIQTPYIHDNIVNVSNSNSGQIRLVTTSATVLNNQIVTKNGNLGIEIDSSGNLLNTTVSGNTITSGDGLNSPGIFLTSNGDISNVIISDNSITLGNANNIYGILLQGNTISKILIQNNTVSIRAGDSTRGIFLSSSENISNIDIAYNSITTGSGVNGIGIYLFSNSGSVTNSILSHNTASAGPGGGGISLTSFSGSVTNSTLSYNTASAGSGGVGISLTSSSGSVTNSTLSYNTASVEGTGRGIILFSTSGSVTNSILSHNTGSAGTSGVGISLQSSSGSVTNSTLSYNTGSAGDSNARGIILFSTSGSIRNSTLSHNTGSAGTGGRGISLEGHSDVTDSILSYNTAAAGNTDGTGLYLFSDLGSITNATLSNNIATAPSGSSNNGIRINPHSNSDSSCVTLIENTSNSTILLLNQGTADLILNTPASHGNDPTPTTTGSTGPVLFETCGE